MRQQRRTCVSGTEHRTGARRRRHRRRRNPRAGRRLRLLEDTAAGARRRGQGLKLINALSDRVELDSGESGTTITMSFRLPPAESN
ncbi:PAS/PAC sensor hybrid histidine kinase domain protein [Mycobacterium xenopi 4042]|uniref:PAS/PAC sensor hybrid histidine kinase domain protein n=1 Tax=Mycobacterium xenopi 4042 TaxID=1299334 RepID=X8AF39_MYCXE|nr:PAS/PAC sensor hybrid histidine kinase domain protein [Mycobacterium xenopi 4042]